jgi:uncharacterized protein (DUF169 family)
MESNYAKLAETLAASLKLRQPPVAVCFAETVPDSVPRHQGQVAAGCRFWEDAAFGAFATSSADHALCAIGVYTHNLTPPSNHATELTDSLQALGDLGYVTAEDLPQIPVLQSRSAHVVYSPLAETPLAPDVVLLFVNAGQSLILSEATQQVENQNAPAMGRPACAVIPQVMNTGRAALSLGCCGARAYLDVLTDDTALFAIPGKKLAAYTERITALAQANETLWKFHTIRRREVEAGRAPSVKSSLATLGA